VISQTIEAGPHLADQVVSVVQPFQLGAAGEHTVVLQFYPEGLGALRAQVVFSDGTLYGETVLCPYWINDSVFVRFYRT
jgi:hypothetical protein